MTDTYERNLHHDAVEAVLESFQDPGLEADKLPSGLLKTPFDAFRVNSFVTAPGGGYFASVTAEEQRHVLWQVAHNDRGTIVQLWSLTNVTQLEY